MESFSCVGEEEMWIEVFFFNSIFSQNKGKIKQDYFCKFDTFLGIFLKKLMKIKISNNPLKPFHQAIEQEKNKHIHTPTLLSFFLFISLLFREKESSERYFICNKIWLVAVTLFVIMTDSGQHSTSYILFITFFYHFGQCVF